MSIERAIKSGKIKETGKIIQTDNYFKNRQEGYSIRTEYNRDNITFFCLSCEQKLGLYKSNKHNFYLKHLPNSDYCELKEETLLTKEQEIFSQILVAKESERHIFLKNRIGELLKLLKNVSNVKIDDYFIFNNKGEKRKPDIYCEYLDNKIVFEIQLSNLSQRYILGRHDFYKEKGIYLIWILDNFDVEGKTNTELDIKYLSKHQNYFRFKDTINNFQLNCKFKQTHLNTENQFYDKWNEVNISIDKLNFDEENSEVFFYNFLGKKNTLLEIQKKKTIEIEKEKKRITAKKEHEIIVYKIHSFIEKIGDEKEKYKSDFNNLKRELRDFEETELLLLNQVLKLDEREKIFIWLEKGKETDYEFLEFMLESNDIDLDVNGYDKKGYNALYYLIHNEEIYLKEKTLKLLFRRGFKFSEKDESLMKSYYGEGSFDDFQRIILTCNLANHTPKWLIDTLFEYKSQRVISVIESCLKNKIIGFKFKSWVALMNYAIHHYSDYWKYIEVALKSNGLFDKLTSIDRKKTFQKKLNQHHSKTQEYNKNFARLFSHLYPELI